MLIAIAAFVAVYLLLRSWRLIADRRGRRLRAVGVIGPRPAEAIGLSFPSFGGAALITAAPLQSGEIPWQPLPDTSALTSTRMACGR
jgi:hypothetical protein